MEMCLSPSQMVIVKLEEPRAGGSRDTPLTKETRPISFTWAQGYAYCQTQSLRGLGPGRVNHRARSWVISTYSILTRCPLPLSLGGKGIQGNSTKSSSCSGSGWGKLIWGKHPISVTILGTQCRVHAKWRILYTASNKGNPLNHLF